MHMFPVCIPSVSIADILVMCVAMCLQVFAHCIWHKLCLACLWFDGGSAAADSAVNFVCLCCAQVATPLQQAMCDMLAHPGSLDIIALLSLLRTGI